jgi:hypothetical protein
VDFGELNDKTIKGLIYLSKIVSMFYLYIHVIIGIIIGEWILYGSHWRRQIYE